MGNFFNLHDSFLSRHLNATSRKSLEIQACCLENPRTFLTKNWYKKSCFETIVPHESKHAEEQFFTCKVLVLSCKKRWSHLLGQIKVVLYMSWLYATVSQSSSHFKSTDEGSCPESKDIFSRIVYSLLFRRSSFRSLGVSSNPCLHFVPFRMALSSFKYL